MNRMNSWPDTEPTLVRRLSDARDDEAWQRFDALYRPVVYRYARSRGLQHSDAEALVSEVMHRVFRAAARWSSGAGVAGSETGSERPNQFRAWLRRVAENALLNLVTRQLSRRGTGGTSHQLSLAGRPLPDDDSRLQWEQQHRQHLFLTAAGKVKAEVDEDHWRLFWQTHVDGLPIDQAAIRCRILRRLRDAVAKLEQLDEWLPRGETP